MTPDSGSQCDRVATSVSVVELSDGARQLLGDLRRVGRGACVAERMGVYYIIPTPNFNWDARVRVKIVLCPEYIVELVGAGCMVSGLSCVHGRDSQHSCVEEGTTNNIYRLTPLGECEVRRLHACVG